MHVIVREPHSDSCSDRGTERRRSLEEKEGGPARTRRWQKGQVIKRSGQVFWRWVERLGRVKRVPHVHGMGV